ncbi:MAG: leucine-rich repeat protein, partial [Clostridiales bacterium]|nr:leucine-rich repeat protein [Clostridiales bacterium]
MMKNFKAKRMVAAMMALLLCVLTPADAVLCGAASDAESAAEESAEANAENMTEEAAETDAEDTTADDEDTDAGIVAADEDGKTAVASADENETVDSGIATVDEDENTDSEIAITISDENEDADTDTGFLIESVEEVASLDADVVDGTAAVSDEEAASYSGTCGSSSDTSAVKWTLSDGMLTIMGSGDMADYSVSSSKYAPWYSYCTTITSVVIESGVTSIGDYAFMNCTALTSVSIPDTVTYIGGYSFGECTSLTSVVIPDSVTTIDVYAFVYCTSLSSVTLSSSLTTIAAMMFGSCTSLTSITIPDSVTTIEYDAFNYCTSLTSVFISAAVTSIDGLAFSDCYALSSFTVSEDNEYYSSEGGVLFDKAQTTLLLYPCGKTDTSYTIPSTVTTIEEYAFYYCKNLTSVTIPSSVITIGESAFEGCSGLTSVTIPSSITSMGTMVFCDCSGLTSVTFGSGMTEIPDYTFEYCTSLADIEIPDTVTSIGYMAFRGCTALTAVDTGSGVTLVDDYAFYKCTSLATVTIGKNVVSIGTLVFGGCSALEAFTVADGNMTYSAEDGVLLDADQTSLLLYPIGKSDTSYTIPSTVTTIGSYGFYGCTILTTITVPTSVTAVEDYAFSGCKKLTAVYYEGSQTDYDETYAVTVGAGNSYFSSVLYYALSACSYTITESGYTYDGTAIEPTITVTDGDTELTQDTDYTLSSSDNTDAGTASVTIDGAGSYYGSIGPLHYTISAADLSNATVTLSATSYTYDGTAKKPTVSTVIVNGITLKAGTDYTVSSYSNNTNAGTATVTIAGTGNYTGTVEETFTISTASVSGATVTLSATSYTYDGTAKMPTVTVEVDGKTLEKDYTVEYSDNTSAGTATVTITGIGNYTGTVKKTFTINAASVSGATITLSATSYTYDGTAKKPTV